MRLPSTLQRRAPIAGLFRHSTGQDALNVYIKTKHARIVACTQGMTITCTFTVSSAVGTYTRQMWNSAVLSYTAMTMIYLRGSCKCVQTHSHDTHARTHAHILTFVVRMAFHLMLKLFLFVCVAIVKAQRYCALHSVAVVLVVSDLVHTARAGYEGVVERHRSRFRFWDIADSGQSRSSYRFQQRGLTSKIRQTAPEQTRPLRGTHQSSPCL